MGAKHCAAICALLLVTVPGILGLSHSFAHQRQAARIPQEGCGRKTSNYDPSKVDWASVITACREIGRYERRMHSFNIRSCFHDGMAIDSKTHKGGMDASLFTPQERHETGNAGFSTASMRVVMTIAHKYGTSWADALAVCGAVGIDELSFGRAVVIGNGNRFPVGRLDAAQPLPPDNVEIVKEDAYDDVTRFSKLWLDNGFTVEQGVALLGAHALIENLGCQRSSQPGDDCNPNAGSCANQVRMFVWDSHFFNDACTGTINILREPAPERQGTKNDLNAAKQLAKCQYTSSEYMSKRMQGLDKEFQQGKFKVGGDRVKWTNNNCDPSFGGSCPHRSPQWFFTANDAHLGRACQGLSPQVHLQHGSEVQNAMRRFLNPSDWDSVYIPAFVKMVTQSATFVNGQPMFIDGTECPSGQSPKGGCRTAWTSRDHLLPEVETFTTAAETEN